MKPLEGLKVVELARILAGPWAGQALADLGAEVVKVESPEGDDTRRWGPPLVTIARRGTGRRRHRPSGAAGMLMSKATSRMATAPTAMRRPSAS